MLPVRKDIQISQDEGSFQYFNDAVVTASDKKEFLAYQENEKFIADLSFEDSLDYLGIIVFKSNFIKSFQELIPLLQISGTETILEMGGGDCWASALLKRKYPKSYVVGSDLIPTNLRRTQGYEKILNTYLDEKWAFSCRDIPFEEGCFDRIFTFAAFHHFGEEGDFSKAIKEMVRVLKPQGKLVLLYEPSSPKYLYNLTYKRVNTNAPVEEDVLILSKLKQYALALNCKFSAEFFPIYLYREGITETFYYYVLSKLSILQKMLPCTVNIVIEKN